MALDSLLKETYMQKLMGLRDPRGPIGILSRGKNVYNGGSSRAHSGPNINMGRPSPNSINRRLRQNAVNRRS